MDARQHAGFDPDVADLVELAAVEADAVCQHLFAQDLFLQLAEHGLGVGLAVGFRVGIGGDEVLLDLIDGAVVLELLADAHGRLQRLVDLGLDVGLDAGGECLDRDGHLLLAGFLGEVVDHGDDLLDRGVRGVERGDDLLLGYFLGAGLDHHQAVLAADHDEVELALFALLEGRVDDVLTVDQAHADRGDRLLERHIGQRQRHRGAGDRQHVGVVLLVGGQHQRDDLRLVAPAGREQRPRRAVDHPAGQHFFLSHLAFALEEAAGDTAGRVGVFTVVDGQRKEVDAFARVRRVARGDEDHRIAEANDDRAVRLFGELAGFETEGVLSNRDFARMHRCVLSSEF